MLSACCNATSSFAVPDGGRGRLNIRHRQGHALVGIHRDRKTLARSDLCGWKPLDVGSYSELLVSEETESIGSHMTTTR